MLLVPALAFRSESKQEVFSMLLIKLTKGHHKFREPVKLFSPKGKEVGEVQLAGPGDCFKVSQKDYKEKFAYRSELIGGKVQEESEADEDVLEGIIFEAEELEKLDKKKLVEIAAALGYGYAARAGVAKLIEKIIELKPSEDEKKTDDESDVIDELKPTPEWSLERLTAYLDDAEITYTESDPEALLAIALDHYSEKS